jgi:predicted amidohydrolase YtcJ
LHNLAENKHQVAIHAIGDQAVHCALNAIEKVESSFPYVKDLRFRIEHIQMVLPSDLNRFPGLSVLACVQPFALSNPKKDIRILGEVRAREAYPYKSLLDAGAILSFGSDFPSEVDYQPLLGIYYAVTRQDKNGKEKPLNPNEALTVEEALRAYTLGSAYAEFAEKEKGSLEPGKLADFVVLSDNPLTVKASRIKDIKIVYTFVGGTQVFPERH